MNITKITGNTAKINKPTEDFKHVGITGNKQPIKINKPKEISYWNQEIGPTGKIITFGMLGFFIFMMFYLMS